MWLKQVSLIYCVGNTKTDAELVLPKHGILSPQVDRYTIVMSDSLFSFSSVVSSFNQVQSYCYDEYKFFVPYFVFYFIFH